MLSNELGKELMNYLRHSAQLKHKWEIFLCRFRTKLPVKVLLPPFSRTAPWRYRKSQKLFVIFFYERSFSHRSHEDGLSSDGDLCDIEHPVTETTRPKPISVTSISSLNSERLLEGPSKEGWLYKLTKTPAGARVVLPRSNTLLLDASERWLKKTLGKWFSRRMTHLFLPFPAHGWHRYFFNF